MNEHRLIRRHGRRLGDCESLRHFVCTALLALTRGLLLGGAVLLCTSALPAAPANGSEAKPFGISGFTMQTTEASLAEATVNEPYFFDQAAGHPTALTSKVMFATEEIGAEHTLVPTRDPREIIIALPPGLLADPQAIPHCSPEHAERCPTDTQVGVFALHAGFAGDNAALLGPIVNLTPSGEESAELGLETPLGMFLLMGRIVRTPEGYTSAIVASGLPTLGITSMEITLWGVPAAPVHTPLRGVSCIASGNESSVGQGCQETGVPDSEEPAAFLTTPSSCSGVPTAVAWADSWEEPTHYVKAQSTLPAMAYCERLPFTPEITVRPETVIADRPVGINVSIHVPQLGPEAVVAAPPLHGATVTLPPGVAINPAVADGLQSCNATGAAAINIPTGLSANGEPLEPSEVGPGEEVGPGGEPRLAPGSCPKASIVGKVEATTPLLAHPIEGRVYMATPGCGREGQKTCTEQDAVDGNLYRLYIELGGNTPRDEGALIKVEATVTANPATGQLTVHINEVPQLPISELSIQLYGGERGLLANPTTCGPARSTSDLEPWSAPLTPSAAPSSYYEVTGCTSPPPFDPAFLSGSLNVAAGAFSPFTLTITRHDGEQNLAALQVRTPLGLSAMLPSVPLCSEALATAGDCPEASRVGGSEVAAGEGSLPLYMPGNVYLTGPYDGAPYGLAIVTDAAAGPLNLGRLVIRARIDIEPQTAALEITSDALPQIVLGVPLRIQRIGLDLDRPRFVVNPTNCDEQHITASVAAAQGASATITNPYGIADCASLAFKPKIAASTSARTSLAIGASLDMRLTFPKGEPGTNANLARIKVALPKQLPTRLTSLQNSCPQSTFSGNPAACPPASLVGIARARTPVLPGELTGPVYLVAHGRNNLPSPIVVLQSDDVVLKLSGSTTIDKRGIGTVAFNGTPDVPIESLELFLPAGPHSLLAANTSLCTPGTIRAVKRDITKRDHGHTVHRTIVVRERLPATLPMGTELAAHNGAIVHQTTQITVTGCAPSQLAVAHGARAHSRS